MAYALFNSSEKSYLPQHFSEELLRQVSFKIHKFNNRRKLSKDRTVLICAFSEFGCETVGCLYCLPKLVQGYVGQYVIGVGWYGRAYLYKHLVDEFWELDPQYMFLRDRTYAFHHRSKNLTTIEDKLQAYGKVITSNQLGAYLVGNVCRTCGYYWSESLQRAAHCPTCKSTVIIRSMLTTIKEYQKKVRKIPQPRAEYLEWARKLVGNNAVCVFARNRKTYGRNLSVNFYHSIALRLKSSGYTVVWAGEKINSIPPPDGVIDFVSSPYAADLERTLAVICACRFTIQFFTASSRLAGIMGVPFILFESPEQLYPYNFERQNCGQEGKRLDLTTFGNRKVVVCDFKTLAANEDKGIALLEKAIDELEQGDTNDIIGLVPDKELVLEMRRNYSEELQ